MTNLRLRLRKLEAVLTDDAGLMSNAPGWLAYWTERIDRLMSEQDAEGLRIPLDALDAIMAVETLN
jgi:hypothetical protein